MMKMIINNNTTNNNNNNNNNILMTTSPREIEISTETLIQHILFLVGIEPSTLGLTTHTHCGTHQPLTAEPDGTDTAYSSSSSWDH